MRCKQKLSFFIFLLFAIFLMISSIHSSSVYASTSNGIQNVIQTYGQSELTARPDFATISLSIETNNISANEAVKENAKITNAVYDTLIHFGLSEKDIKTGSYRLYSYRERQDNFTDNPQEKIYYQAINEIILSISHLDSIGKIIDLAVNAGVNQVNYINFELRDPQELILKALQMATEQARLKADSIAKSAGKTIKEILSIKEERTAYTPFRLSENVLQKQIGYGAAPTPINPNEVNVSATVIAEFSF